jgi:DNA-binding transcriptional ArsR family regulator
MNKDQKLDLIFKALSDTSRRKMLDILSSRECSVSELAESFDMSLPAVMKHLNVLSTAKLIQQEKSGRVKTCSFEADTMKQVSKWVHKYEKYWTEQLDALESFINSKQP